MTSIMSCNSYNVNRLDNQNISKHDSFSMIQSSPNSIGNITQNTIGLSNNTTFATPNLTSNISNGTFLGGGGLGQNGPGLGLNSFCNMSGLANNNCTATNLNLDTSKFNVQGLNLPVASGSVQNFTNNFGANNFGSNNTNDIGNQIPNNSNSNRSPGQWMPWGQSHKKARKVTDITERPPQKKYWKSNWSTNRKPYKSGGQKISNQCVNFTQNFNMGLNVRNPGLGNITRNLNGSGLGVPNCYQNYGQSGQWENENVNYGAPPGPINYKGWNLNIMGKGGWMKGAAGPNYNMYNINSGVSNQGKSSPNSGNYWPAMKNSGDWYGQSLNYYSNSGKLSSNCGTLNGNILDEVDSSWTKSANHPTKKTPVRDDENSDTKGNPTASVTEDSETNCITAKNDNRDDCEMANDCDIPEPPADDAE